MSETAKKKAEAPPSGDPGEPGARAYNDLGQVRPADARYLGDASGNVLDADLQAQREKEIEEATARLQQQREEEEKANQERLEAAGYRNPTLPADAKKK